MPTFYQLTISDQADFIPPRVSVRDFLDYILASRPTLLSPKRHKELMLEFARYAGLDPDNWGICLEAIKWLLERSPDVERACRAFRADAL